MGVVQVDIKKVKVKARSNLLKRAMMLFSFINERWDVFGMDFLLNNGTDILDKIKYLF